MKAILILAVLAIAILAVVFYSTNPIIKEEVNKSVRGWLNMLGLKKGDKS